MFTCVQNDGRRYSYIYLLQREKKYEKRFLSRELQQIAHFLPQLASILRITLFSTYFKIVFNNLDCDNMRFQQDGATTHTTRESYCLTTFHEDRIIYHRSQFTRPARSSDLKPMIFFFSGFVKAKVRRKELASIEELEQAVVVCVRYV